ncbi:hypothetical protein MIND_00287600 [Mycena indigotica]|uniref:Uncharacterized protein n=1 Tax=Mycena indigotica TaxID=2126181 RepID=A0A8H6T9C5_9AGAR|nr:uncharacterized protein MIND_00287600 [Mycena indigotica]KAF7312727.1 hypothetical protein MIND_00287600 [Mycena indigotica]
MGNDQSMPTPASLLDDFQRGADQGQAFGGPTFFQDNARANELKDEANALFRARDFDGALAAYTDIINTYDDRVMIDTIRTIRCNRAACFLNLGDQRFDSNATATTKDEARRLNAAAAEAYQGCVDDCNIVVLFLGSESVTEKAKLRRKLATKGLNDIDALRKAADPTYPGRPKYDVDERRRQQMQESSALAAKFVDKTVREEHRPFEYAVRREYDDEEYVSMRDMVPISLMRGPRSEEEKDSFDAKLGAFVRKIVTAHEPELMSTSDWKCFVCNEKATTWLHAPIANLESFYPIINDYGRPICHKRGRCAETAKTDMKKEQVTMMEEGVWIETHEDQ